ncbi:hypothetical protein FNH22_00760 [Fulvivirga sp. M361]|uniref:hypothetical protein n=1 Tax=Fulvivirga sp. M361 TaxID=2594266 RepID=UPI00117AB915|nr:hypothetical protein [Fulvivirga sp. M361]TRX62658.1 hypothetical protein FNH22_00760 [Fulvivirga sp. M361]
MAEFIAENKSVEVSKHGIGSLANSMERGRDTRLKILLDNGIDPENGEWHELQKYLNAFKDIAQKIGEMNLFIIGKAVMNNAEFPPMKDLEEALNSMDIAYHMNHRLNGEIMFNPSNGKMIEGIGHYKLAKFDAQSKQAVMICTNPYPSKFDEGILTEVVRRFKPTGAREKIELDLSKESRKTGGESCTFLISW